MSWTGLRVCVAGAGVSGVAAARVLADAGAVVTVVDARGELDRDVVAELEGRGVTLRLGDGESLPEGAELVVTSPGWRPDAPLLVSAAAAGTEVIGDVELAWRLRTPGAAPWLAVTGTDGKTTVVRMLAAMLGAAGYKAMAVGNVGTPITEIVQGPAGGCNNAHDVLAVELSSFQLHWSSQIEPQAAVVLNVAPDHLDWHGSFDAYAAAKGKIFGPGTLAVVNADDEWSCRIGSERRSCGEGGAITPPSPHESESEPIGVAFTLGEPGAGQLGVAGDVLVDRAFADKPVELARVSDVRPYAPHNVANALAAAALARAYGVPPEAVRDGLRAFEPDRHRIEHIATIGGVAYVNDSKATNPHAAAASLAAYDPVVWIVGGLLKNADVDELVRGAAPRLRGVVLIGADRARIARALARHASDVPVSEVAATHTGAMDLIVPEASRMARPGDTVLLAPAGSSFDMFANYPARGDAFAAAVRRLADGA